MPNVPPMGVFGVGPGAAAAPTEAVDAVATLPGETAPRNVLEIWATAPGSTVPKLVWSRTPGVPASPLTQAYSAGAVTVTWVAPTITKQDGYDIKRPDGTLAGSAAQGATSFVDSAPRPLNGAYTVTAKLGGLSGTPTATPTLNLAASAASVTAVWNGTSAVNVGWAHPAYGAPHNYGVYRNGVLLATLAGTSTSWVDAGPPRGTQPTYVVVPVLSGVNGGNAGSATVSVPAAAPTSVGLSSPSVDTLRLVWAAPAGTVTGYEVQRYVSSTGPWTAWATYGTGVFSSDWGTAVSGYMRVRALSAGGASAWVQAGPVSPIPPLPVIDPDPNGFYGASGWFYLAWTALPGTTYDVERFAQIEFDGWGQSWTRLATDSTASNQNYWNGGYPADTDGFYMRVRAHRDGVYSDWVQRGPGRVVTPHTSF